LAIKSKGFLYVGQILMSLKVWFEAARLPYQRL
jgi:hypothetical protein